MAEKETHREVAERIAGFTLVAFYVADAVRKQIAADIEKALADERERCARAICPFCAEPEFYGPVEEIEGAQRLWHRDLRNREHGVIQCFAAAIRNGDTDV